MSESDNSIETVATSDDKPSTLPRGIPLHLLTRCSWCEGGVGCSYCEKGVVIPDPTRQFRSATIL